MQLFDLPIFLQGIIRRYRVVIFQTWFMGSSSRRFLKRFLAKKLRLASRNSKKIIGCHGDRGSRTGQFHNGGFSVAFQGLKIDHY